MDCREAHELILDSLAIPEDPARNADLEDHIIACEACRKFCKEQLELDRQLTIAIPVPLLSPQFRVSVMASLRRDRFDLWRDSLPDIAHVAGCVAAIGVLLRLLPFSVPSILSAGFAVALLTYFLQSVVRGSIEALEDSCE